MCAKTIILLWLTALAACCQGDTITIGDKEYTKTVLVNNGAIRHIVVNNGHILYRSPSLQVIKLDTMESISVEGMKYYILVQDLAIDGTGAVWVVTEDGLFKMESIDSNVTYVAGDDLDMWSVAVDSTNSVYVSEFLSEDVYVFRNNALHKVPEIKANSIAFSNNGDVYYIKGASNKYVSKKKGMQATERTKITMPESHTAWTMDLDKNTDTLYILSDSNHLFYVPPGGTAALQVDGINDTKAIGTDDQGNIYVGTKNGIYKLSPVPTETENVL